ncbi:MAG TPA: c-type cytochrome [Mycobacteriales bacterium]|jgi:ubiquinol-cytochrome c reductase cytochrome c subunit|nr:c-type cytochrome [Mycobacteriales bacterium]
MRRPTLKTAGPALALVALLGVPTAVWGSQPLRQDPSPSASGAATGAPDADVAAGQRLFETSCATCHGFGGTGTDNGPRLMGVGAASADFYLSTGRMPLPFSDLRARRKRPAFNEQQIDQLVAYVASLGEGPPIPDVDLEAADVGHGGELFRLNCASCHGFAGSGGALSDGNQAPALWDATPTEIVEAIRIGPGTMPVFSEETLSKEDADAIAKYTSYLGDATDRGGAPLDYGGPIPEGFVVWLLGLGLLIGASVWIGRTR